MCVSVCVYIEGPGRGPPSLEMAVHKTCRICQSASLKVLGRADTAAPRSRKSAMSSPRWEVKAWDG